MAPDMTLEQLAAREAIRELKARYCYHLDLQEWDALAALYASDATMDVDQAVSTRGRSSDPRPQVRGRAAIRADVSATLADAETVHQVHSPIIELLSATRAKAIWAMEDIVRMPGLYLEGRGHYHETYVVEDGEWRIASLHLTRTWLNVRQGEL